MSDMFTQQPYAGHPGFQHRDTSIEAAKDIAPSADNLRSLVLDFVKRKGMWGATADEISQGLGIDPLSIRPRCTELNRTVPPTIVDSGQRRLGLARGRKGRRHKQIVWMLLPTVQIMNEMDRRIKWADERNNLTEGL